MASIDRSLASLSLYKHKSNSIGSATSQAERRRELLQRQKEKRDSIVSQLRFSSTDAPTTTKAKRRPKVECPIGMMMAEWLFSRPDDFGSWFVVPIPKGQRCLVVQRGNQTEVFNKNERFLRTLSTALPRQTILFCIFERQTSLFHIVDLLMWNGQDYSTQVECQCRFFVLASLDGDRRLAERFRIVPRGQIDQFDALPPCADGYLFYHPLGFYQPGDSPLVCWLEPFLVEEILQMKLSFQCEKPLNYISAENYMLNEQTTRRAPPDRTTSIDEEMPQC